ncbi:hypothetical protein [Candidatus Binatus sp.]|uniref:hypothetical protein n=1 Tax=Candidatus Binatus sp. TaxID=2811406 RepID=UPI002F947321
MKLRLSRAMMLAASLLLLISFAKPLWHYDFEAPQYPEGLPMIIYLDHLGGRVDLVNELNHYIGMHKIVESDFAEFRMIPALVVFFCIVGIVVAASKRLWVLVGWVVGLAIAGLLGLADFYSWLYMYGHELDPHAAIRIPPFTPHLLGAYRMMNFRIVSYPGIGGIAIILAAVLGFLALVMEWAHGSFRGAPAIAPIGSEIAPGHPHPGAAR